MELHIYANKKILTLEEKLWDESLLGFEKLVEVKCVSDVANAAYMVGEELSSGEFHSQAVNHRTTPDNMCNTFIFLTFCNGLRIERLKVKVLPKINTAIFTDTRVLGFA